MQFTRRELALLLVATDHMSNTTTVPGERQDLMKLWDRIREQIEHQDFDPDEQLKQEIQDLAASGTWTLYALVEGLKSWEGNPQHKRVLSAIWTLESEGIIKVNREFANQPVTLA
jgi:DNA phosphorothioation-dependent restriction protein DptG